jgi:hypothetical protein
MIRGEHRLNKTGRRFPFVLTDGCHRRRNQRDRWCYLDVASPPQTSSIRFGRAIATTVASHSVSSFLPSLGQNNLELK